MDNIHIDRATGKAAIMVTRVPAWHKLGQVIMKDGVNKWEAMSEALLNWEVQKVQLNSPLDGSPINAWGMFRSDTNVFLGAVGKDYVPLQNRYAFDFVDTVLEATNGAHYVTAGALGDGEKMWCLARIPQADMEIVKGDKHEAYLLFTTSHDRSIAATCKVVLTRVVCQNTLTAALSEKSAQLRIRHVANMGKKMDQAQALIQGTILTSKEIEAKLKKLAETRISRDQFSTVMMRLFGDEEHGTISQAGLTKIKEIAELMDSNDRGAYPEIKGTAYNLLNAITEHTDHVRRTFVGEEREEAVRACSALLSGGAKVKETAMVEIVRLMADGTEVVEMEQREIAPVNAMGGLLDDVINNTMLVN